MLTDRQLALQQKKLDTEQRRGILDRVCSAAMHVIYESDLYETSLWPKKGFQAGFRSEFDKSESIKYSARVEFEMGQPTWQAIYFNILNKSGARCCKQAKQIDLILDHAIYDGVHFSSQQTERYHFFYKECFFTGLQCTGIHFKFTIQQ